MHSTRSLSAAAVAALFLATGLQAQGEASAVDWDGLRRAAHGRSAVVRLVDGASIDARRAHFDAGAVQLDGRRVTCSEIASVTVQKKSRRTLWAGIGAAAGAAAGIALATRFSNEGNDSAAAATVVGLAGAGAGVGALAGGKRSSRSLQLAPGACGA
ncbi:MAG: hypothetical protein GC160_04270 [Acidobacteria bacterium]|nr:hypothetical protein [Acidobacteriota bacterium]